MTVKRDPADPTPARPALFASYRPAAHGGWDEVVDGQGNLRSHWQTLSAQLDTLTQDQLDQRSEHARRLIRENGVTFNVYGDPRGLDRPWQLDTLPQVIAGAEWDKVAAGLAQRAHLLDLILADCYGPQRLLREGHLPKAVVFGHPGFLRACHDLAVPGGRHLHLYGADLVRGPDGSWRVLADRAQSPTGAGYALENRIVLSRALPEAYRACRVRRLAAFFAATREALAHLAPRHRDNPRIVLLTPGPYNESYFEHAYLARYLGYTLVEGGDLTVRDDSVYLKTLGGLHQVDVILRRLDDDFCDPLELRNDSTLGIPGLVQAARSGNVAIVNGLGSGLAQNAALMPLLPALCRHLLSEDLMLPSQETWWCAAPAGRAQIRDHLQRLVIKSAFGPGRGEPIFASRLDEQGLADLRGRIAARPYGFVAQEEVTLSTTPVLHGGSLQARPMALRAFAVATSDAYAVMPGGLTRLSAEQSRTMVSMQRGGGSKDTWVLADAPVEHITLLRPAGAPIELRRGGIDLPSRVADNLFWLGRYAERAEDCARLIRAAVLRLVDDPGAFAERELAGVVAALRRCGLMASDAPAPSTLPEIEDILLALLHDPHRECALPATLHRLHHAAFVVRDRLSNDTWRVINHLDRELESRPPMATRLGDALSLLNRLIANLAALAGMGMENTTRGPGWRFLDLGRRLERASFSADLLRALITGSDSEPGLDLLLDIADSALTYRSRYLSTLQTGAVLDLLLVDATNPRSLAFQLVSIVDHVAHLPREQDRALPTNEERLALAIDTSLRLADPIDLVRSANVDQLESLLERTSDDLGQLCDSITRTYLSHLVSERSAHPGTVAPTAEVPAPPSD